MDNNEQATEGQQTNDLPLNEEQTTTTAAATEGETTTGSAAELSDQQLLEAMSKKFGKEFKSLDEFKPNEPELTSEEKTIVATSKDKKLLDKFLQTQGNTIEQFANLKRIANADIKEVSISDTRNEMLAAGFSAEQTETTLKERYYLLTEEEKAELGEEDKDLLKKSEFFSKKLGGRSGYKVQQAQGFLKILEEAVLEDDLLVQSEANLSSTVEDYAKKVQRILEFDLGTSNDVALKPVKFEIDDTTIASVTDIFREPAKRNNFLYNADGSLKLGEIMDAMIAQKTIPLLVKKAALQGATEQVEIFESKFGKNPQTVAPGTVASTGKTAPVGKAIEGTEQVSYNAKRPQGAK